MKKSLSAVVILCLLLSACGGSPKAESEPSDVEVNPYAVTDDGARAEQTVTMTAVEDSATPTQVTVTVLNTTALEIDSGNEWDFYLQVEQDGQWYDLKTKDGERANTSEAYIYEPNVPRELTFQWSSIYGTLEPGHYRVVKSFFEFHEEETERDKRIIVFSLAAEFDVE